MRLVWHIVRKDFRRIAGPLALWLLLVLLHTFLVVLWTGPDGANRADFEGRRYFVSTCGVIVMGVGFILAAWLVMEDGLVSSRAFWRSRPVSGGRLLAAKALGALVFLGVLPVLVLTPVWLGCGFSVRELLHAAAEFVAAQALCSIVALALGSVTESSGQFLVRLAVGFLALPLITVYAMGSLPVNAAVSDGLQVSRSLLVTGLAGITPFAMIGNQFLTRHTGRSWAIFLVGVVLMVVAGRAWPWNFTNLSPTYPALEQSTSVGPRFRGLKLTASPLNSLGNREPLRLEGKVTGMAPGEHVRVDRVKAWWQEGGRVAAGPRFTGLAANGQPDEEAVRQSAGLQASYDGEAGWSASGRETTEVLEGIQRRGGHLIGEVNASVLHGTVLGELPLRVGATLREGSSMTRIADISRVDGKLVVQLEERDAWLLADAGLYSNSYDPARRRTRPHENRFLVLNRSLGFEQVPGVEEVGTINANSLLTGRRNLVIELPSSADAAPGNMPGWLEGALIVKVRFTPVRHITQRLEGEALPLTR